MRYNRATARGRRISPRHTTPPEREGNRGENGRELLHSPSPTPGDQGRKLRQEKASTHVGEALVKLCLEVPYDEKKFDPLQHLVPCTSGRKSLGRKSSKGVDLKLASAPQGKWHGLFLGLFFDALTRRCPQCNGSPKTSKCTPGSAASLLLLLLLLPVADQASIDAPHLPSERGGMHQWLHCASPLVRKYPAAEWRGRCKASPFGLGTCSAATTLESA